LGIRSTILDFRSVRVRDDDWEGMRFGMSELVDSNLAAQPGGALTANGGIRDNVIATGRGPESWRRLIEARRKEVGVLSIGFNIRLPLKQNADPYSTPELTFQSHYFALHKMHLAVHANARSRSDLGHSTSFPNSGPCPKPATSSPSQTFFRPAI
jgi:hypothetical protein